jgi:Tfp pilus assembly protein PilW
MKIKYQDYKKRSRSFAFTMVELLVAFTIALVVIGGTMVFFSFAAVATSGVIGQTVLNAKSGNAIEFIQARIQLATMISNDVAGNSLTLGFDDSPTVDSDGDGKAFNDVNHLEEFKFIGINGTNSETASSNKLVYYRIKGQTANKVLVPTGVRNLPGFKIFTITNVTTAIIRFGLVDTYKRDHYQAVDIQGTGVSLNRPAVTNVISILP